MGSALAMLHPRLREAMARLGYGKLLPIQEKSIPVVLRGMDAIIVAPTGSGKTEAALFPILSMMVSRGEPSGGGVKLVYVTPLRALNRDLELRIARLAESVGYKVMVRHGDTGPSGRRKFLSEPPDIVITTPESFSLLITVERAQKVFKAVKWVVVDEFHELMESKRGVELMLALKKLELIAGRRLQRIALSATLSRNTLREAAKLLSLDSHVEVVEDTGGRELEYRVVVIEGELDSESRGSFWERSVKVIADIIRGEKGSTLIFTNTRSTAEMLASSLSEELGEEVPAHHGSLSRHVREDAERRFRSGEAKAIVATSSLELGIDIGHVNLVIQFLSPRQVISLTQRAGRSGHRYGGRSRAVIIVPRNLYEIMEAGVIGFRASRGHLEDLKIPPKPYDALAHFTVGAAIDGTPPSGEDVYKLATSTYPYSRLSYEEFESIIDYLGSVRLVRLDDGRLRPGRRAMKYFYKTSMIPDERTYTAVDIVSGREVGELSERFVVFRLMKSESQRIESRPTVVLGGRLWRILDIDLDRLRVTLSPVAEGVAAVPMWEGELIPVDYKVARELCSIIALAMEDEEAARRLLKARGLGGEADYIIGVAREAARAWGGPPGPGEVIVESLEGGAILYACLGSKGNFALALLISKIMSGMGVEASFNYIPYAIVFRSTYSYRIGGHVKRAMELAKAMDEATRLSMIHDAVRNTTAYLVRFYHVAKRMGAIDPDANISLHQVEKMAEGLRGSPIDVETLREIVYEKLDIDAMNSFLEETNKVRVVEARHISRLGVEVLGNPYLRAERGVNAKLIGVNVLIEAKKRSLSSKTVRLLCLTCLKHHEAKISSIPYKTVYRCPNCSSLALAPLPPGERGEAMITAYMKRRRGEKLSREEKKLAEELVERAEVYINYAQTGLSRHVLEAFTALGVGPKRAKKLLSDLQVLGEEEFYLGLIRAEEEYVAYRRFWNK